MLDFVNAFKHENEGTVVEAKNLQGLEVQLTYHLDGSNYNYKTVIFEEDMTDHSQYFENKYSYNTGVLVPCTKFKCKLTCYYVIRWFVTNSWKLKNQLCQFVCFYCFEYCKKKKNKGMRQYWNKKIKIYKLEKYHFFTCKTLFFILFFIRQFLKKKKRTCESTFFLCAKKKGRSSHTGGNQDNVRTDDDESEWEASLKDKRTRYISRKRRLQITMNGIQIKQAIASCLLWKFFFHVNTIMFVCINSHFLTVVLLKKWSFFIISLLKLYFQI
ncbi:hypothetical protein RFI_33186 [Reticulomyxa filosa]|uniref:Uncharacterized protein n=1 Tax=Reticulomyxa filosa TaxID=46433 RepID=X6LS38_RETFI|nr:hypothetical protein RFI_33186 [Reticulomyxa filosa]|eukprot:ETO04211.1 hypothetical protein RFI_33186 [Reticulomyxa filosa]